MNILFIQHRQIGDVLMCTPAVRVLRRHCPDADITFCVEPFSFEVLKHNPYIDNCIVPSRKPGIREWCSLHWRVRRRRFDAVIDFFKNPKSALLTRISGADIRVSLKGKYRNYAYTETVDMGSRYDYAAVQKLRLLRPLGIDEEEDCMPDFFITDREREWAGSAWRAMGFSGTEFVTAVSPVSRKAYRVWPAEYYAEVCDYLAEKYGARILLTWGPDEEHFIEPIVRSMKHDPVTDYPMPSLAELYALLEKCSLFIGNDNGPRHMAVAAGIPTVGLFGKTVPSSWTPPGADLHTTLRPEPRSGHDGKKVYNIADLKPSHVIAGLDTKLEKFL